MDTDIKTKDKGAGAQEGPQEPSNGPVALPEPSAEDMRAQRAAAEGRTDQVEAVRLAAAVGAGESKGTLTTEAQASALDWFLSDEEVPMSYELDVDIGPPDAKRVVVWTITAISSETLKRAREAARAGNRSRRRGVAAAGGPAEIDDLEMNSRIIVAGSIDPDLVEAARRRHAPEHPDPMTAPVQLLQHRLRHKPGLIDQIAMEILRISGYDDDDIREHEAGKA